MTTRKVNEAITTAVACLTAAGIALSITMAIIDGSRQQEPVGVPPLPSYKVPLSRAAIQHNRVLSQIQASRATRFAQGGT